MAKRRRPPGSRTVHPDRDRMVHFMVEWVMLKTGLGVGRGATNAKQVDACAVAARLLNGGYVLKRHKWLIQALVHDHSLFQWQIEGVIDRPRLLDQLRRVGAATVRNAYVKVQGKTPWRSSVREDINRAERTRAVLSGELVRDAPFMKGDDPA